MFKTAARYREATLGKFGGLYTEADARSLPSGASPLCHDVDFQLAEVNIRPGQTTALAPTGAGTFQWLKGASLPGGLQLTISQDTAGKLYAENLASPGTAASFYAGIINNARAFSETFDQREYILFSDLTQGLDQPRQYDGTYLDRISQAGPGAGPIAPNVGATLNNIVSIQQPYTAQSIDSASWAAAINLYHAQPSATTLTILGAVGAGAAWLGDVATGDNIYISGMGNLEGVNPNGTYAVVTSGFYTDADGTRPYIQVNAATANSDFARGTAGGTYRKTIAIVTLTNPLSLEDAQVGSKLVIAGATPTGWNGSWPIAATPTVGQLLIEATSAALGIATYTYAIVSGTAPGWQPATEYLLGSRLIDSYGHVWQATVPGESGSSVPFPSTPSGPVTDGQVTWTYQSGATITVTVFNTANGNGIFNVQSATLTAATSTTFSVAIAGANVSTAAEQGQAVSGQATVLAIDPGVAALTSGHPGKNPIFGTDTGTGIVAATGSNVAAGQRYAIMMFLTRNGSITPASPPVSFFTTGDTATVEFSNMATGPPDVIARIIAITGANSGIGGPYFWIPKPVTMPVTATALGETVTISATIIHDNTSTESGPLTLNDTVLLNPANSVTMPGNNVVQQRELGECVKAVEYFGRGFYLGERTKVDNLLNASFDGGVVNALPAGWQTATGAATGPQYVQSANWNHNVSGTGATTVAVPLTSMPVTGGHYILVIATAQTTFSGVIAMAVSDSQGNTYTDLGAIPGNQYAQAHLFVARANSTGSLTVTIQYVLTGAVVALIGYIGEYTNLGAFEAIGGAGIFTSGAVHTSLTTTVPHDLLVALSEYIYYPAYTAIGGTAGFTTREADGTTAGLLVQDASAATSGSYTAGATFTGMFGGLNGNGFIWLFGFRVANPAGSVAWSVVDSPIVNTALLITAGASGTANPAGTALANLATLWQSAYQDAYETPIIDPALAYSVRVVCATPTGTTSGALVVGLYSPSLNQAWTLSVQCSAMSTTPREFIGALGNPLWNDVPSDLRFFVLPSNVPANTQILVDRVELFISKEPVYSRQLAASYAGNTEAIDGVTGAVDTSAFTSETQTNVFRFLEQLFVTTDNKTFAVRNEASEPDEWEIREISNTVGCLGPLAEDVGEEYVVTAAKKGVFIFDGGNHSKFSQEIQKVWDALYQPALKTVWVKNDIQNKRILMGVPLPTPNRWLPKAATNATPSSPNVILCCSYLGLETGQAISEGQAVAPSMFAGHLLFKDGHRKWTIWQIPAAYGNWIPRPDTSTDFWVGTAGKINALDPTVLTDNGAVIPQRYMTFGFNDEETEKGLQLGSARKLYGYALCKIEGAGGWQLTPYVETPASPYAEPQPNFDLANPALDDTNVPLNETGNAMFLDFETDGNAGSWFSLKQVILGATRDSWIPVSGV